MSIAPKSPCPERTISEPAIKSWPMWTCEPSTFSWTYSEKETCLILEGDITVTPNGGKPVRFGVGDLIVFLKECLVFGKYIKRSESTFVLATKYTK